MTINVTQKNIDEGTRGDCYWCPIALAIRDLLGVGVTVTTKFVRFPRKYGNQRRNLPPHIREWQAHYDHGGLLTMPIKFELRNLKP